MTEQEITAKFKEIIEAENLAHKLKEELHKASGLYIEGCKYNKELNSDYEAMTRISKIFDKPIEFKPFNCEDCKYTTEASITIDGVTFYTLGYLKNGQFIKDCPEKEEDK